MKIAVCIKQVPDTAAKISVKADGSGIEEAGLKFIISPYDEFALEEALLAKDSLGECEVVAISLGPKRCQEALRSALAMGCDRAIHIHFDDERNLDSMMVSRALAKIQGEEKFDVILTGRHAADQDNAQVGPMLAETLGIPQVTMVNELQWSKDSKVVRVQKEVSSGAREKWEVQLPALFAVTKTEHAPRYASLKGIMQAKKKPLDEKPLLSLGLSDQEMKPKVSLRAFQQPADVRKAKIFKDNVDEAVKEVVRLLRDEAKVI